MTGLDVDLLARLVGEHFRAGRHGYSTHACGNAIAAEYVRNVGAQTTVDEAWAMAEAALPTQWQMAVYRRTDGTYTAVAKRFGGGRAGWGTTVNGPTGKGSLTDALRDLAARLTATPSPTTPASRLLVGEE